MAVEVKKISGYLNTDDEDDVIPPNHMKMLINGKMRGNGDNKRIENLKGTRQIYNQYLTSLGTNITIGSFFDFQQQRIFWFVYNTLGYHAIYIIDLDTEIIIPLIRNYVNSTTDVLSFTAENVITSVQIIYGDTQQGDILYWVNSQGLPCQINISQMLNGEYGTVKKEFLNVIKAIPTIPPQVVYRDNDGITVNNLRRKLYKFKYRFIYNNNDKSCWSSHSIIPLPLYYDTIDQEADPSINAEIAMVLQTGDTNIKKIEVAACESQGDEFGKFFSVALLDKSILSIPSNDTTIFQFFNDKAYNIIDELESVQLFDLVPLAANAMELLNGNVLIYGGITESYNPITDFTNGIGDTTYMLAQYENAIQSQQPVILVTTQYGQTAYGDGDIIHIIVMGKVHENDEFNIYTTSTTITYTASVVDTASSVLLGLASSAVAAGYSVISVDDDNLYISKLSVELERSFLDFDEGSFSESDSSYSFDWWSVYGGALVYFDAEGRSCGAVTIGTLSTQTFEYIESAGTVQYPIILAEIFHRPPLEAKYFQWVITKNLSKSNLIQWISDRTFKDVVPDLTNYSYAYISIATLNTFIEDNPLTPLGYEFKPNDRIRFIKRYTGTGGTAFVYEDKDFQIQSSVINPKINGYPYTGQFIKIILPETDSTFDFGGAEFQNYFIELYTPAQSVANGLDIYYEFGQRYQVLFPGTDDRCHQGELTNQSSDLVDSAIFQFRKGDDYFRSRNINAANEIKYSIIPDEIAITFSYIGLQISESYTSSGWIATTQQNGRADDDMNQNTNVLITITDGLEHTFRFSGTVYGKAITATIAGPRISAVVGDPNAGFITEISNRIANIVPESDLVFIINADVTVPAGETKLIITLECSDPSFAMRVISGELNFLDTGKVFTQQIIDPNFSDYYPSAVNSYGRAWVVNINAAQIYNQTLLRWGLQYQINTNINQTNRFYDESYDEIDRSKGSIQRLMIDGRQLYAYQEVGVGVLGVYAKFLQDSNGQQVVTTTNDIITRNNVQYLKGDYGMGLHPEGLYRSSAAHFFFDPVRGYWVRRAENGLTPLNEFSKGQFYMRNLLVQYNKVWTRPDGTKAKMLGCYDFFEEQAMVFLQSGTNGGDTTDAYAWSYNEKENHFVSFYTLYPEWVQSAHEKIVLFLDGKIYLQDNDELYNNFFGVQYETQITLVFNDVRMQKKSWVSISEFANQKWVAPLIYTQVDTYSNVRQESNLGAAEFALLEGQYHASFKRDINSSGGKINGDFLKGGYMVITLKPVDSSIATYLSGLTIKINDSPLTNR